MAAIKNVEKVSLQLQVDNGVSSTGAALSKTYTYNNVKPAATADAILTAGNALGGLAGHELQGVYCNEKSLLTTEG
ncbi:MAG: DUF1659 domain-containing protein [Acholeplasmataceae bacterium]|jgi:hypothetical protein|nr:DUF1659 domain-containing protein [Acidaminococcaceae bacterium]NLY83955.1 DUF1659 domain-containing protein [Acholeplasmataceae bacterium]